ncbi:LysR family transcriptional regulator [Granulicella arctica]|uniref:LysR family transcriptional regulator n=1 Tax=Granulicella arctica TaxID=940613 RepID=UPI0037BF4EDC
MELGPDFRLYESFVAIAEDCSFRKAAEKLPISQPALSGQIKKLEAWVGHRVLHRGRSGSALTEPGPNLLVYARYLLHLRRDAKKASSRNILRWNGRLGLATRHSSITSSSTKRLRPTTRSSRLGNNKNHRLEPPKAPHCQPSFGRVSWRPSKSGIIARSSS